MRGHDERGETFWPLLWCDSWLMEPGPGWWRGVGLRTERAERFLWWPSQHSSRCAMKPYITILLYCVVLTVSWLWRSLQTLGRSSRKPNPASWLQHGPCASERGTEKEKAVDIIPAASITITLLTNWKPKSTRPALTHFPPNPSTISHGRHEKQLHLPFSKSGTHFQWGMLHILWRESISISSLWHFYDPPHWLYPISPARILCLH